MPLVFGALRLCVLICPFANSSAIITVRRRMLLPAGIAALAILLGAATTMAQTTQPQTSTVAPSPQPETPIQKAATTRKGFVLEDGTPVRLRIGRTVSSADAHVGDTVDFEVLEDVQVDGALVIPKGGLAFATVTEAQAKRRMARGGKLNLNIDSARLASGEKAALRAVKEVKGGGHTGAMTGGIVATAIVFFPAAPFFLFMHGKDIAIPKGTEITAYVNGNMQLDRSKFQPKQPVSTAAPSPGSSAVSSGAPEQNTSAELEVSSTPPGADIEIDGNFVGSTPSTIGIAAGQHQIVIKKSGFKPWEKTITVSSGHANINAELEAEAK